MLALDKHSPELRLPRQHSGCEGGLSGGSSLLSAWVMLWQRNAASFAVTDIKECPPKFALKSPRQVTNMALGVPKAVSAIEMRRVLSLLGSCTLGVVWVPNNPKGLCNLDASCCHQSLA